MASRLREVGILGVAAHVGNTAFFNTKSPFYCSVNLDCIPSCFFDNEDFMLFFGLAVGIPVFLRIPSCLTR